MADADMLVDYAEVRAHDNRGSKVVVPTQGRVFAVSIPLAVPGAKCLVYNGRIAIRLNLGFQRAMGNEYAKKTSVWHEWESPVYYPSDYASCVSFFLDEEGRLYRQPDGDP